MPKPARTTHRPGLEKIRRSPLTPPTARYNQFGICKDHGPDAAHPDRGSPRLRGGHGALMSEFIEVIESKELTDDTPRRGVTPYPERGHARINLLLTVVCIRFWPAMKGRGGVTGTTRVPAGCAMIRVSYPAGRLPPRRACAGHQAPAGIPNPRRAPTEPPRPAPTIPPGTVKPSPQRNAPCRGFQSQCLFRHRILNC